MKARQLSGLEQAVMSVVWKYKRCSVKEARSRLKKKLAYTTVATILQRLQGKGFVTRKKNGPVLLYAPRVTKELYSRNLVQSFINKFLNSFGDVAIASFADSLDNLPKKKRDYLLKLLERHDENKNK